MDVGTAKLAPARARRRRPPPARRPRRHRDRLGRGLPAGCARGDRGPAGRGPHARAGRRLRALRAGRGGRAGVPRHRRGAARASWRRSSPPSGRPCCTPGWPPSIPPPRPRCCPSNGRRIVRALEVVALTGRPFPARLATGGPPRYDAVLLGVDRPTGELDERVARRVARMFAAGLVAETRTLLDRGLREGRTASRALGYQQVVAALDGHGDLGTRGGRHGARDAAVRPQAALLVPPRPADRLARPGPGSAGAGASYAGGMTGIAFAKGHGTENDFVVLPDPDGALDLTAARVAALCDRRRGLGADGVLRVVRWAALKDDATSPPSRASSGSWTTATPTAASAEMCGNGVRVYAHWLDRAGWLPDGGTAAARAPGPGCARCGSPATRWPSTWARRASGRRRPPTVGGADVRRDGRGRRQPAPGLRHRRRAGRAGPDRRARPRPRAVPARGERRVRVAGARRAGGDAGARARGGGDPLVRHRHGRRRRRRAARRGPGRPATSRCARPAAGCGSPSPTRRPCCTARPCSSRPASWTRLVGATR